MSEEQNKINIIDKVLSSETALQEYLDTIEKQNIEIPQKLDKTIINNIKIVNTIKENKRPYAFIDILKVACFALIAVLSWEVGFSKIDNIDYSNLKEKNQTVFFSKQDNKISDKLGEFMMGDIFKGGEK